MSLIKRSFTVAGHRTSVALEADFWTAVENIAAQETKTLAQFVAAIDASRTPDQPLASALRVMALRKASKNLLF